LALFCSAEPPRADLFFLKRPPPAPFLGPFSCAQHLSRRFLDGPFVRPFLRSCCLFPTCSGLSFRPPANLFDSRVRPMLCFFVFLIGVSVSLGCVWWCPPTASFWLTCSLSFLTIAFIRAPFPLKPPCFILTNLMRAPGHALCPPFFAGGVNRSSSVRHLFKVACLSFYDFFFFFFLSHRGRTLLYFFLRGYVKGLLWRSVAVFLPVRFGPKDVCRSPSARYPACFFSLFLPPPGLQVVPFSRQFFQFPDGPSGCQLCFTFF